MGPFKSSIVDTRKKLVLGSVFSRIAKPRPKTMMHRQIPMSNARIKILQEKIATKKHEKDKAKKDSRESETEILNVTGIGTNGSQIEMIDPSATLNTTNGSSESDDSSSPGSSPLRKRLKQETVGGVKEGLDGASIPGSAGATTKDATSDLSNIENYILGVGDFPCQIVSVCGNQPQPLGRRTSSPTIANAAGSVVDVPLPPDSQSSSVLSSSQNFFNLN